ncbi:MULTISPECIES: FAD-binding oxidoreductase [unclassified Bacillus (in: firmicutes)]|uniref:NAD(P)/FAD-dependent oxidoreductase n=1 Tax=unclassified Bacillus (in: firmicutes) TaxID=185979 RepID=UPI0008EB8E2A|nr:MULTISPECIES: FAD-binding oxidoreductase [unclassified Bacillus (in: firmicutes)]SFA69710.1 Glycine/D-amino acid oxidase [Bacillus sp. UNCCL13]SFQ59042.1 Glycine/D-amino acid oxidase [Bacillus sp. cl95]
MNRLSLLSLQVDKETTRSAQKARNTYDVLKESLFQDFRVKKSNNHITIIGGGIVGLMSAYFLQKCGFQITVLEKKSFGAAASGRNGGGVLSLGRELNEIPFARLATEIWSELDREGIDTKYTASGHVMVARNPIEEQMLLAAQDLYLESGLDVKAVNPDELKRMAPDLHPNLKMGLFSHSDGQSYPFTTSTSLKSYLKENGAKLIDHCNVVGFHTKNGSIVTVSTDQGNFESDVFLLCAGPWTTEMCDSLGESVLIKPRRSQILVTEILSKRRIHPFVTGNSLYLRQTHAGNVLFGGGGPWEISGFDVSNTNYALELLSSRLLELFPSFKNKQLIRAFAGTVEITEDHLPYFGGLTKFDNAFISAGYNGHGYGMSAVMGKIMAQNLCYYFEGRKNPIEDPFLSQFSVVRSRIKEEKQSV